MIAIAKNTKHPILVYSHLYSSSEEGFISENEETYNGLHHISNVLSEKIAIFVIEHGYDYVEMMKILKHQDNFTIR